MIEDPVVAVRSSITNSFGSPYLFRTYEEQSDSHNGVELRSYHKPIMLSGGIGNIQKVVLSVETRTDCVGRSWNEHLVSGGANVMHLLPVQDFADLYFSLI
ncbi:MAG: Phosphoribosylformylglycinamidine synthase [Sodalis sp. Ffu]|nr:MAG: Phosphoribosylformylglycinamidine synthase [Sodalis sp. Ffu]